MTDVMKDLLIDFDEMGFAPTTLCPNPDKYACKWKAKLVAEINFLQEQLEATIAGQKSLQKALAEKEREVEQLTAEKDSLIKTFGECQTEAVREFAERYAESFIVLFNLNYGQTEAARELRKRIVKEMIQHFCFCRR